MADEQKKLFIPGSQLSIQPPIGADGKPMSRFEVKVRPGKNEVVEKAIFIDGELLDWAIDISSLMEAIRMGPQYALAAKKDIERHFTNSVSETLGRRVTAEDIKKAIQTGWI